MRFSQEKPIAIPIEDIYNHVDDWAGKRVIVTGLVSESAGFGTLGVYDISDRTGELTITTQNTVPSNNRLFSVEIEVRKIMTFGGDDYLIGIEVNKTQISKKYTDSGLKNE